jgi:hypothetical protein
MRHEQQLCVASWVPLCLFLLVMILPPSGASAQTPSISLHTDSSVTSAGGQMQADNYLTPGSPSSDSHAANLNVAGATVTTSATAQLGATQLVYTASNMNMNTIGQMQLNASVNDTGPAQLTADQQAMFTEIFAVNSSTVAKGTTVACLLLGTLNYASGGPINVSASITGSAGFPGGAFTPLSITAFGPGTPAGGNLDQVLDLEVGQWVELTGNLALNAQLDLPSGGSEGASGYDSLQVTLTPLPTATLNLVVPEPACLSIIAMCAAPLLARRRRVA